MEDRELLEMAAKAAGYTYFHDGYDNYMHYPCIEVDGFPVKWEPLTDDGDALRLAVRLKVDIAIDESEVQVAWTDSNKVRWIDEPAVHDLQAVTRRAIVRAAAAIGRARK